MISRRSMRFGVERRGVGDQREELLVLLDLGALPGVHRVFDGQGVQAEAGLQGDHLVLGGVDEVEPDEGRGVAAGAGGLLERQRLGDALPVPVHGDGRLHGTSGFAAGAADTCPGAAGCDILRRRRGTWRSLVAHLLWEQGAGGSNPPVPTRHPGACERDEGRNEVAPA